MAQMALTQRIEEITADLAAVRHSLSRLGEQRSDYARQHTALLYCFTDILKILRAALGQENEYVNQLQSTDSLEHTPVL